MKIFHSKYLLTFLVIHLFVISAWGTTAQFSYTQRSKCAPTIVEFTNTSTAGSGVTYTWDFGLGSVVSTSDYTNKTQLYTKPGTYKVTLTVKEGSNTETVTQTITIAQGPSANFSALPLQGCPPLLVNYTSTSTSGSSDIASVAWDFRNGDYGSGATTQYTYNSTGKYDVVLKVTDKNGCYSQMESDSLIEVVDKPVVNFKATDTFACSPPLNVTFVNLSSGATDLTYNWNYGNGQTSTDLSNSTVYDTLGSYNVKLTATDQYGCSNSITKSSYIRIGNTTGTIAVYDANNRIVTKSTLCNGTYKFVFSLSNLPNYVWSISNNGNKTTISGQNSITYLISDTGSLSINLLYGDNLCSDSITKVYTKSSVKASFTLDATLFCAVPQNVNLQNTSTNADSYSWYLSNQYFSSSEDPSYTITKNDLPATTYKQLYSHEINTTKLPFKLIATNGAGCTDTIIKEATLSLPVARFMPDKVSGCIPLQVSLSDSSHSAFKINEYTYKIGSVEVTTTTTTPVIYTFTKPGEYYITEVIKSGSCYDTSYSVKVVVGEKLIPDFTVTPSKICNGGTIQIAGSSNNNSVVNSWKIQSPNLFDYTFSSKPDTAITVYSDDLGAKDVSLQLDYNGCFSDTTKKAAFEVTGLTGNFYESFTCDSSLVYHFKSKINPATSLAWNVDTAVFTNVDSLRYKFKKSGDYTVKLIATDNSSSCALTRTKQIKVRQIKASFTVNDSVFCAGDTVRMNASTSNDYINTCYNEGFLWYFGDDSPPRRTFLTNYYHIYETKGTDTLLLITTADNGCTDSIKKIIYVYKPQGIFVTDKDSGCLTHLAVKFTNTSTDSTVVKWTWSFGDNAIDSSNTITVSHTYISSMQKTYNPTLTVNDAYGCFSNYSLPIKLIGVNSDFQADDNAICAGQTITFSPVDQTLDSLFWQFGDGSTSDNINSHTYNNKGKFTISLSASKNGCRDTVTKLNYVSVEKADADFLVDSIQSCYPDTLEFIHTNLNGSSATELLWKFDSRTLTDTNSDTVKYIYNKPGNYIAKLTVKTLNGCEASRTKNIVISGPTASFDYSPKKICYNEAVSFQLDSLSNSSTWEWLFGDGNTSTDNPVSHRYTSRGTIVPSLILTSGNCVVTNTLDTLTISSVKASFYNTGDSSHACYGSKLSFYNASTNAISYNWKVNKVLASTEFDLSDVLFSINGDNNVQLIATGSDLCTDTFTRTYTVVPIPVFSITGDSTMCKGVESVTLSVQKETGWTINWTPISGLSTPTLFSTIAQPSSTTTYTAEVTDMYGCTATREKTILINQPFNLIRSPLSDTSIYLGEKIQLTVTADTGSVDYSWSPNYNISCLNCNNPFVSPTKDVTYIVEVKNNCFDFTETFNIKVIIDFYLEAPSAFTPNGDSNNDVYKFETENLETFNLKIFNRWGELVFSTNDVLQGWDGRVNGHAQNIDTYTYIIKAVTLHGYKFEKRGSFLLLK